MQETEFGGEDVTTERRVIHFTSGDTLDLDSEEEEEEDRPPFRDTERKARRSIKNLAMRVGRLSLLVVSRTLQDQVFCRFTGGCSENLRNNRSWSVLETTVMESKGAMLTTHTSTGSLQVCDFLGERLSGVFGLNDAKYQYAIDQHRRKKKAIESEDPGTTPLSPEVSRSHYGATEDICPGEGRIHNEDQHQDKGQLNRGYQEEDSPLQ